MPTCIGSRRPRSAITAASASELDLFHLQEEAPGAVFWHPKGWTVFQTLIAYMRERQRAAGYEEVSAPELMDASSVAAVRAPGEVRREHVSHPDARTSGCTPSSP